MIPRPGALRVAAVANLLIALASIYLAARAGDGAVLGPARTDDLPYGDLLRLDRAGALVWLVVSVVGLAAAVLANRVLLAVSGGLWGVVSAVMMVVVVTQGDLWGAARPSNLGFSLGLALTAAVAWWEVRASSPGAGDPSPA